jgi:tRNA threonylcarbamoyladenosine biosynthesis protein TsaE
MQKKSSSLSETKKYAGKSAKSFLFKKTKGAFLVGLSGNLGSGKTAFLKGLGEKLGIQETIISPTFVLMRRYQIPKKERTIIHIDAYRLKSKKEFNTVLVPKERKNPQNIIFIEWPEYIPGLQKKLHAEIFFKHGKNKNERIIEIKKYG